MSSLSLRVFKLHLSCHPCWGPEDINSALAHLGFLADLSQLSPCLAQRQTSSTHVRLQPSLCTLGNSSRRLAFVGSIVTVGVADTNTRQDNDSGINGPLIRGPEHSGNITSCPPDTLPHTFVFKALLCVLERPP